MKDAVVKSMITLLVVQAGFSTPSFAAVASIRIATKRPTTSVVAIIEGAIGRACKVTATNSQVDMNTCKPFTIPQEAVAGLPVTVPAPTRNSGAWLAQGDQTVPPLACYVRYGWDKARCIRMNTLPPQGYALTLRKLPNEGFRLQFVRTNQNILTSDDQLTNMLKFRSDLRITMNKAMADIRKSVSMVNDCGGEDPNGYPDDDPYFKAGSHQANVMEGGGCGDEGGGDGGGYPGGDPGAGDYPGQGGDGPWTAAGFDGFANEMVDADFSDAMMEFVADTKTKPMQSCSAVVQNCMNTCSTLSDLEQLGCASLGVVAAGVLKNKGIGLSVEVYCAGKVSLASLQCKSQCNILTVPCTR